MRQNLGANAMRLAARYEHNLRRELEFHIELLTLDFERAGRTSADARRRALVAFGGIEPVKEECRDARRFAGMLRASRVLLAAARGR